MRPHSSRLRSARAFLTLLLLLTPALADDGGYYVMPFNTDPPITVDGKLDD